MRTLILSLLIFSVTSLAYSQTPQKTVPSQKQIQEQMQIAINELNKEIAALEVQIADAKKNKEDKEAIKSLEDQRDMLKKQVDMMGGVSKGVLKVSDKTLQNSYQDDNNTDVPKKDVARIKMMPDKILSNGELISFIKNIHSEVDRLLSKKDKTEAMKIFDLASSTKKSSNYLNNIASTLWLSGYTEMALYMMGKTCTADMGNFNNLNNYAAFLTMSGAEHAALPILQNLNRQFPNNSTILNNIAQSWYGLGEMNNANRYLDSTVKIYKNHSQANETKSKIQKSEGKTEESIESLKRSMEENYTPEKESRLYELGYEVKFEDIKFKYPVKPEPLGIEKFIFSIPAYPFQGGPVAQISKYEWYDFRAKLKAAIETINKEIEVLKPLADSFSLRVLKNPLLLKPLNTPQYKTANRKLTLLLTQWAIERTETLVKRKYEIDEQIGMWRIEYNNATRNVEDCGPRKGAATTFNLNANSLLSQWNGQWMSFQKQLMNAHANLTVYASPDRATYLLFIAVIKSKFLSQLAGLQCEFEVGCLESETPSSQRGALPDFDSVNCDYKEEIFIPPFTNIKIECNKMTTDFDIGVDFGSFAVNVKAGLEDNLNTGKITKATLEVGADAGFDEVDLGPLKAEAKIEGGVGIEVTQDGVREVYVKGGVTGELEVGATSDLQSNVSVSAGVETKVSWNAGDKGTSGSINSSLTGQGALKSINIVGPK